jgi:hypothetical protein
LLAIFALNNNEKPRFIFAFIFRHPHHPPATALAAGQPLAANPEANLAIPMKFKISG